MTGYRSSHFRHSCQMKGCYIEQLPCWDSLIECFPRNIRPTDVDGFVEINGHFLFLEEKGPGVAIDNGQRIALQKLSRYPGITVAFFRPGRVSDLEVLIFDGTPAAGWQPRTRAQWHDWVHGWARRADAQLGQGASRPPAA